MKRSKWWQVPVSEDKISHTIGMASELQHNQGMTWYQRAHMNATVIAMDAEITVRHAAGIIAALSPMTTWEGNLRDAANLARRKRTTFTTYPANVSKAKLIRRGASPESVLGGHKVTSFFRLIYDPTNDYDVCVDRHAVKVCTEHQWIDDRESAQYLRVCYHNCAEAYRNVAKALGILPHQAQAISWIVQREQS